MTRIREKIDSAAGRIYARVVGLIAAVAGAAMLVASLLSWRDDSPVGAAIWMLGAIVFAGIARSSFRSRAGLSDVDFTG